MLLHELPVIYQNRVWIQVFLVWIGHICAFLCHLPSSHTIYAPSSINSHQTKIKAHTWSSVPNWRHTLDPRRTEGTHLILVELKAHTWSSSNWRHTPGPWRTKGIHLILVELKAHTWSWTNYSYTRAFRNRGPGVYAPFLIFSYRVEVQTSTN
jgi:hypothetical protein